MSIDSKLSEILETLEVKHYGWAALETPRSLHIYQEWIEKGYHGEMSYLKRHLPEKEDPTRLLPQAKSAIVFRENYLPHPEARAEFKGLTIAKYAQGDDYHNWFQEKLNSVCVQLKKEFPDHEFMAFTDSKPVLERDLAHKAGLGWVGKNTCLIDQKEGSLFFIGEIYTSLEFQSFPTVAPDRCGTCTRCIDACPTGALEEPRVLNSNKCISYWTIEARTIPTVELREQFGAWYFGCDICQDVCPWNEKAFGKEMLLKSTPSLDKSGEMRQQTIADLRQILTASNSQLERLFVGTALSRTSPVGHRRNALIVVGNLNFIELKSEVEHFLSHESLGELAGWTMNNLVML